MRGERDRCVSLVQIRYDRGEALQPSLLRYDVTFNRRHLECKCTLGYDGQNEVSHCRPM